MLLFSEIDNIFQKIDKFSMDFSIQRLKFNEYFLRSSDFGIRMIREYG